MTAYVCSENQRFRPTLLPDEIRDTIRTVGGFAVRGGSNSLVRTTPFAETVGRFREWRSVSGITHARTPGLAFSSRGRHAGGVLRRPGDRILQYDDVS